MPMSFPVSFLLGRELSKSVGVVAPADQTASGIALAVTGGTPLGIVLARQMALNRVPSAAPLSTAPAPQAPAPVGGVAQAPVAAFVFASNGLEVQFFDQSTGTISRRRWRFLDGTSTSTDANPKYTYKAAGTYQVELKVYDAAGSSNTTVCAVTVGVVAMPPTPGADTTVALAAGFRFTVTERKVAFEDQSIGTPSKREWDFGDGKGKSSEVDPVYDYASDKQYQVTLRLYDDSGGSNTSTRIVQVGNPAATASAPAPTKP